MIKADHATTEKKEVTLDIPQGNLRDALRFLRFPVNQAERKSLAHLDSLERELANYERYIEDYKRAMTEQKGNAKQMRRRAVVERKKFPDIKFLTEEEGMNVIRELTKLAWIEHVYMSGSSLVVRTVPGSLKTSFDVRTVDLGNGRWTEEFLAEPVFAPMPQYEIAINLRSWGEKLANNSERLGIRLINKLDTSKFLAGKVAIQEVHAHWASSGGNRIGHWESLCLGEYEKDIQHAGKDGLVPFFNAMVAYLQTAGDEHAFRTKRQWALWLGKPEYDFVIRTLKKGEKEEAIKAEYKRLFREHRQPDIKEGATVNPGEGMNIVNEADTFDAFVEMTRIQRNNRAVRRTPPQVMWNGAAMPGAFTVGINPDAVEIQGQGMPDLQTNAYTQIVDAWDEPFG